MTESTNTSDNGNTITLTFPRPSDDMLQEILTDAIAYSYEWFYWSNIDQRYNGADASDTIVSAHATEAIPDDDGSSDASDLDGATINAESILEGMLDTAHERVRTNAAIREEIIKALVNNDASDIHGDTADCIIQAIVFGELRYG